MVAGNSFSYLFLGVAALLSLCHNCGAATNPNATNLVLGVVAARQQIPASSLRLHYEFRGLFNAGKSDYSVDFDSEKRRFIADAPSRERGVYDGQRAITFNPEQTKDAEIRDVKAKNGNLLFDPRLLGLTPYYFWHSTLHDIMRMDIASRIEALGQETVNRTRCWRVLLSYGNPVLSRSTMWVDEKNAFRVHRFHYNETDIVSFYDNPHYPWLPSRTVNSEYDENGKIVFVRQFDVTKGTPKKAIPESTWRISGLHLPIGTQVNDLRINRRVGYWDGNGLGQDPFPPQNRHLDQRLSRGVIAMMILLFLVAPIAYLWRGGRQNYPRSAQ